MIMYKKHFPPELYACNNKISITTLYHNTSLARSQSWVYLPQKTRWIHKIQRTKIVFPKALSYPCHQKNSKATCTCMLLSYFHIMIKTKLILVSTQGKHALNRFGSRQQTENNNKVGTRNGSLNNNKKV